MARGTLNMSMDKSGIEALDGYINTLNATIKTPRYMGPVLEYAHGVMAEEFNNHMDRLAAATHDNDDYMDSPFHHVYEWDMVGVPQGRLWSNRLEGHGARRWATFNWRASKRTVPVPDDELGPNAGERAFKRIHVFVWKAMVMEFDTEVTVTPKRGKWLGWESSGEKSIDGLEFSRGPVTFNPGGGNTTGSFTAAYAAWWGGAGAEAIFDREIRRTMERNLKRGIENTLPSGKRATNKTFALSSISGRGGVRGPGFARGAAAARAFLEANRREYIADAIRREEFADEYGGGYE